VTQHPGTSVKTGGESSFSGQGNIVLDSLDNDFGGRVNLQGKDAVVADSNGLRLGEVALSGDLLLRVPGTLDLGQGQVGGRLVAPGQQQALLEQTGLIAAGGRFKQVPTESAAAAAQAQAVRAASSGSTQGLSGANPRLMAAVLPVSGSAGSAGSASGSAVLKVNLPEAWLPTRQTGQAGQAGQGAGVARVARFTLNNAEGEAMQFEAELVGDQLLVRRMRPAGAANPGGTSSAAGSGSAAQPDLNGLNEAALQAVERQLGVSKEQITLTYLVP